MQARISTHERSSEAIATKLQALIASVNSMQHHAGAGLKQQRNYLNRGMYAEKTEVISCSPQTQPPTFPFAVIDPSSFTYMVKISVIDDDNHCW